eukprot:CAMPEP_0194734322 /NCGR_PEP_ID=MMETSP0296-20130528/69124_1 /TAXON_ID=39354 /ORGANISM="Heterosigma akashiwo, Strain CCMP2393" /LENGTH=101 /DNA_ID=CAMNT_0039643071 /DNA_START=338 /DNA_END=643 /DNA_ORIENTATION=+
MAAKDDIKLRAFFCQALVIWHPHVGQSNYHLAPLAAQQALQRAALLHKVHVLHVVDVHRAQRLQPLALDEAHQADFMARPLKDPVFLAISQRFVCSFVVGI